ncbi:MAG: M13 family metallopeptidase [Acidobacteriota bacterium]|nr:M13 family metallopeptidase [Acidobacteriota bacterium]
MKLHKHLICALPLLAATLAGQEIAPGTIAGFDAGALDKTANPCTDFYQYACGTWLKNNPVPPDQASWGRFSELAERNRTVLKNILEKAASTDGSRPPIQKQIGDYYASCMDEAAIERKGAEVLKPELDRIRALASVSGLSAAIARLHNLGVDAFFSFGSGQDFKDSTAVIAQADQGGLGLPERDYYLKDDPKSKEIRQKYVEHMRKMFVLMGSTPDQAAAQARSVMDLETELAKGSQDVVTRRDPAKIYHKMTLAELQKLTPDFAWPVYLADIHAPKFDVINVGAPEFFGTFERVLKTGDMNQIRSYLAWHYVHTEAPLLPKAFVDENFDFYGKVLTGAKEQKARWKRCVAFTDNELGEALGQSYVERTFGAEGKERTLKMVHALEKSLGEDIRKLDWMTPETKAKALEKLHAITNKIGYPEKWRDYSSVKIVRGDMLGNSERATQFEFHRQLDKIGRPVDRLEWGMTPPTVNAYYDPQMNNINFPAGILQPPFFDKSVDDAVNFGAIGAVIGHELTHGFDDEGRQFDATGNLRDWWTPKDADAFETRTKCIVDEYSSFTVDGDLKLNGKLTLGENTADNGGLRIAYAALMNSLAGKMPPPRDGLTAQQRFFLGWGQVWCDNETDEYRRLIAQTNPHSIDKYRVNGVVSNMPEFQQAFGCKAGDPMVREKTCKVW